MIPGLTIVRKPLETYLCVRGADGDRELTALECELLFNAHAAFGRKQAYVPDIVKNAMLTAWNEICADSEHHPLDLEHGHGKRLTFKPRHWANLAGDLAAIDIANLFNIPPEDFLVPPSPSEAEFLAKLERDCREPDPKTVVGGPRRIEGEPT